MARFQEPPHFRNVFVQLPDGTFQIDQGWHDWFLDLARVNTEASGAYQPLDSDLTAIAALTTTSFGRSLLILADAAAARANLGLGTLATQSGTYGQVIAADAAADTTTWPLLATSQTGDQQPRTDAGLTFDASTNALSVDSLVLTKEVSKGIKVDTTTPTFPWHDMLGSIDVRGVGANDPSWNVFRNGIRAYQFGLNDECWLAFHLLHDYVPGTDIYLHAHWAHASAGVTSGGVTWSFEITYAKGHNQAAYPATKTTTVTQTASTTQYQHMIAETTISVAGGSATLLDSSLFETDGMLLVRTSLTGNTMNGAPDPFLFLCDCHYQSTGIGTKQKAPNFYV
jgi:hypothetical protein